MSHTHVEIPAVWLDQVILDDLDLGGGAFIQILNRNPEPGQTDVRRDTTISLDLAYSAGSTITDANIWISVDGAPEVLAAAFGGPEPGWDGPESGTVFVDANTIRLILDPTTDFESLQSVTVRLEATSDGGPDLPISINQSWTFVIEDVTAPVLVTAKAREKDVVRLSFDEPINLTQAVDPANYAFTRLQVPAVDVVAQSVTVVDTATVDVALDIEMTPGLEYQVQVSNVEDLFGNPIVAPFDTQTFTGFQPQVPDGRSFDLLRMLPRKNRDEDPGDLRRFVACLQEVADLLLCQVDRWPDILDPDIAPESFVDAMLIDMGNPFDFDLTLTDKRRLLRILVGIYQQKGTDPGIVNAIRFFLGIEVEIFAFNSEGWILGEDELGDSLTEGTAILGPGTSFALYSFDIESPVALTVEERERIVEIANYMKPAHTHLINIIEPEIPEVIDHLELGLSELGVDWLLH